MQAYLQQRVQAIRGRRDTLYYLDVIRGIAAILVMIGHLRALFFVDFARVNNQNLLVRAVYFITGFGHQAVMVFFVLSGFFIALNVWGALLEQRWSWSWYLTQRLSRLWIVLLPALLIGAFWDRLGITLFGTRHIYAGLDPYILYYPVEPRLSIEAFLGNLLFLQNIQVETFGSNGPLWSLANEFWYYLMFPCLVLILNGPSLAKRALCGLALIIMGSFIGWGMTLAFGLWLMGVIVTLLPLGPIKPRWARYLLVSVVGGLLLLILTLVRLQLYIPATGGDLLIAAAFALLVYAMLNFGAPHRQGNVLVGAQQKRYSLIGGFSYTLYLAHMPLVVFLSAWSYELLGAKWQPNLLPLALGVVVSCGVIVYAWLIAQLTEAKTDNLRRMLMRCRTALVGQRTA